MAFAFRQDFFILFGKVCVKPDCAHIRPVCINDGVFRKIAIVSRAVDIGLQETVPIRRHMAFPVFLCIISQKLLLPHSFRQRGILPFLFRNLDAAFCKNLRHLLIFVVSFRKAFIYGSCPPAFVCSLIVKRNFIRQQLPLCIQRYNGAVGKRQVLYPRTFYNFPVRRFAPSEKFGSLARKSVFPQIQYLSAVCALRIHRTKIRAVSVIYNPVCFARNIYICDIGLIRYQITSGSGCRKKFRLC